MTNGEDFVMDDTELDKLKKSTNCKKSFCCLVSQKCLCKAKDIGVNGYMECLEQDPHECNFAIPFGLAYLCECSIRHYWKETHRHRSE